MEELLKNKTVWILIIGVLVVATLIKALWNFNKLILGVVVLIGIVLAILYGGHLDGVWGEFYQE